MTFISIAWRNLTKRPKRTAVLLLAIIMGVFSMILYLALIEGFNELMLDSVVDSSLGHIQIHRRDYLLKKDLKLVIPRSGEICGKIVKIPHVTGYSERILSQGLISSPESSTFVAVYGVDPAKENSVTNILTDIKRGRVFKPSDVRGVVIGEALAAKLKVGLEDKVVIMVRNLQGDMEGSALRVKGIYKGPSEDFEKSTAYISIEEARRILGIEKDFHEIAVKLGKSQFVDESADLMKSEITDKSVSVQTWKELAPVLTQQLEMYKYSTSFMFLLVVIALTFGIINSFMMEIFERIREFGIMMSLGTSPGQIFLTLVYEGLFLGFLGTGIGTAFCLVLINLIMKNTLDLSSFSKGMEFAKISSIVPVNITGMNILICVSTVVLTVVLATVYPAWRASRFRPVDALREI